VRTTATVRIAMMMRRLKVERTTVATVMSSAYTHARIRVSNQVRIRVRRSRRHASPSRSLSPGPSRSTIPMRKKRCTRSTRSTSSTSSTSSMVTELGLPLLTRILRRLPRGSLE
jgi:hypothetical protein